MGKQNPRLFPAPAALGGSQSASSVTQAKAPTGGIVSAPLAQQPVVAPVQETIAPPAQNATSVPYFYGDDEKLQAEKRFRVPTVWGR